MGPSGLQGTTLLALSPANLRFSVPLLVLSLTVMSCGVVAHRKVGPSELEYG